MRRDVLIHQKCSQMVYSVKWLKQSATGSANLRSPDFHARFGSYQGYCSRLFGKDRGSESLKGSKFYNMDRAIRFNVRECFGTLITSIAVAVGIAIEPGNELKNRND